MRLKLNNKIVAAVIIITVIVASIGIYYLSLPSAPIEVSPQILSTVSYVLNDTANYFVVDGEIKNNLETTIESIHINVTYYDAENNVIDTSSAYKEMSNVPPIQPGQKGSFKIKLVLNYLAKIPDRYDLLLSYVKSSNEAFPEFVVLNRTSSFDENEYFIIKGWVQFVGLGKAMGLRVISTYYDQYGNVTGVAETYRSAWIYNGDKLSFEISSEPRKVTPASYELLVTSTKYEPPPIERIELIAILLAIFIIFIIYMKKRRGW